MEKEQEGIKEILSKLEDEELFGLALTVTHGLMKNKISNRKDAFEVIMRHSPDALSILKRRAVTKDILFAYLNDNNITVTLPTVKDKLIDKVCAFWKELSEKCRLSEETVVQNIQEERCDSEINIMAQKFSEWFYNLMNQNDCIGSEHFFPDATLKLNILSHVNIIREAKTPEDIVKSLFKTKFEYNLYFNPNLSTDGVQGRVDPHGLVMILTCGTLHSVNACTGVFEQVFALARDPFCENNWKIKNTELNLRSKSGVTELPSLCDEDLTSGLLMLPEA